MENTSAVGMQDRVRRIVSKIQGLPTLPSVLNKLNQMILNPRTSAKEVAHVISNDPALTSKMLRVVNSSFYGFPTRITTITHAIVILGFNTIKSIILSSTIFETFRKDSKVSTFDRSAFWKHSVACGAGAVVLARRLRYPMPEELFIAGLLHDIGKIVLDQFVSEPFNQALAMAREKNMLLVDAETEILGVSHAEIGAWLFEQWNLSKGIVETTRCHHNPALASENQKVVEAVHLADILARAIRFGNGGDNRIPMISEAAWAALGLETSQLDDLLREIGEEVEKALVFLDITK